MSFPTREWLFPTKILQNQLTGDNIAKNNKVPAQ